MMKYLFSCLCLLSLIFFGCPDLTFACGIPSDASSSDARRSLQPKLVGGDIIVFIDAVQNQGSATFSLYNESKQKIQIALKAGSFTFSTPSNGQTSLSRAAFNQKDPPMIVPVLKKDIDPGGTFTVELVVSNFFQMGEAKATLFSNGVGIGKIVAFKRDVPFSLSVVSIDPNKPVLNIKHGKNIPILLKNDDTLTYPIQLKLIDVNKSSIIDELETVVDARSITKLEFKPSEELVTDWFSGLFRDKEIDANIVIRYKSQGKIDKFYPPQKNISLKLIAVYHSENRKAWIGNLLILLFLSVGGITSLVLNLWIPNKLNRIKLLSKLESLARETSMISSNIDSEMRIGIRIERLRIAQKIRTVWILNADAPTIYKEYSGQIDSLNNRIKIINTLSQAVEALDSFSHSVKNAPICILDDVHDQLVKATKILKTTGSEDAEFQEVRTIIDNAFESLDKIADEKPDLAASFSESVVNLEKIYQPLSQIPKCRELKGKLPELFDAIDKEDYKDKTNIFPYHYHWLSSTIEALYILRHYIHLYDAATPDKRSNIVEYEPQLIEFLQIKTWYAIRRARQLRYKLHQGISTKDFEDELSNKQLSVIVEPYQTLPNELVRLNIQMNNRKFQACAAQKEYTCIWDFGAIGKEEGWHIFHYFRKQSEASFDVSFRKPDGTMVMDPKTGKVQKQDASVQLKKSMKGILGEKAIIELIWLAVALLIAFISLIAGARDQLAKLDPFSGVVAVFLIGFGADTVKNLFSKGASKST